MMKSASQLNMAKDSFGEGSRQFRRTVYSHDDWVKHRSSDRFVRNIASFTNSGVYANLAKEVIATTTVSAFVVVWNAIFGDYQDLLGNFHPGPLKDSIIPVLSLPLTPFTLSSSSLGLLLTFRANTAYKRWDEARKNWGMNINHTRDLVRMGNAYYDRSAVSEEQAESDLKNLALCTWAFVRSMKRHLSPEWEDEEAFKWELKEKLPNEQAERIINAAHRPNRALQDLSVAIENLPMHFFRKNEIHAAATIFEDNLGSSERLLTSPIPLFYQRHTSRFISIWLLLLPLALWEPFKESWNHIDMIPATTMLSLLLFGIDEIGIQLEEPFTILPMQAFCDKIYNWCNEIVSFKPGDNGMPVYQYDNYSMGDTPKAAKESSAAQAAPVAAKSVPSVPAPVEASKSEPSVVIAPPTPDHKITKVAEKKIDRNGMPVFDYPAAPEPAHLVVAAESTPEAYVIPEPFMPEPSASVQRLDRNGMPIFDQPAVTFNYNRYSNGSETYETKMEETPGVVFNYNRFDIGSEHPEEDLKAVVAAQKKVDHNGMPIFNYNQYNINSDYGSTTSNSEFSTKSSSQTSYELV
jgi:predicted membrane chloride channel (bestrophin family)